MASKNTLSESVEEVAEEVTSVSTSTATVAAATQKRLGVVRYCQVRELNSAWARVMCNRYKSEVHTLAEWDELYERVRNRKIG